MPKNPQIPGLWKRGNTFWFKIRVGEKVHAGSLQTNDLQEALGRLDAQRRALFAESSANGIRAALEDYVVWRTDRNTMAERTVESVRYHITRFIEDSELSLLRQISKGEVERFYRRQRERSSEQTAQKYVNSLKGLLSWCVDMGRLPFNPAKEVKMARLKQTYKSRYCTTEQMGRIFDACEREDVRFVLYCGFHAGLRVGEIVECRPDWFDLNAKPNGIIQIRPTDTWEPKDRDIRAVPLTREFRDFIECYGLRSPYMLHPEKEAEGGIWRYRWDPRRPFKKTCTDAGLPWVGFHVMRHTFASRLVSASVSVYKVAQWLGDDVRVVQRHYGHLQPDTGDIEKGLS